MKIRVPPNKSSDSGAALITVLVMVAIMSAIAILVVDVAQFAIRRTSNQTQMDQARWYLLGAEGFASERLGALTRLQSGASTEFAATQGQPLTYPLDNGVMTIRLYDGSNCFNLNSLVEQDESGSLRPSARGQIQFAQLIDALALQGVNAAGLVANVTDYIDSDQSPLPGGTEDAPAIRAGQAPYRTANTLLGDVSEVLSVRGFDPETVAAIAPLICVRETALPNVINVNTLRPDQAVLIAIAFGPGLTVSQARSVLSSRPTQGWQDVETFLSHPAFAGLENLDEIRTRFSTRPQFVVVRADIQLRDTVEKSATLIEIGPPTRVLRRVLGATVTERSV